mgnify:CR=1 FL=1
MSVVRKRLVITGNCQTQSLATALGLLLREVSIEALTVRPNPDRQWLDETAAAINGCDTWLSMNWIGNESLQKRITGIENLRIPSLWFAAFQPDMIYALDQSGQRFRGLNNYHSAIFLWAWKAGLTPEKAVSLFDDGLLNDLGYTRSWQDSVKAMETVFSKTHIEFLPFWRRLKRTGMFMHTVNHPKKEGIALLAKAIAVTLRDDVKLWDEPIDRVMDDRLDNNVWPIYPAIASELGLHGDYRFRIMGEIFPDLMTSAQAYWSCYQGVSGDAYSPARADNLRFEKIMLEHARAKGLIAK